MKLPKVAVGDIVQIVFWDHCENWHDGIQFEVYGKIKSITPQAYVIGTWLHHSAVERAADNSDDKNESHFAIVKAAVDIIQVLAIKKLK